MAAVLRTLNINFYGVNLFLALFLVAFINLIPDFVQEVLPGTIALVRAALDDSVVYFPKHYLSPVVYLVS